MEGDRPSYASCSTRERYQRAFLGSVDGVGVYLFNNEDILNDDFIDRLPHHEGRKIIYCGGTQLSIGGDKGSRDNLEHFINDDNGLQPLVKMAIIHYQFEAIHPFTDGNGRTGRILNILYLMQQELLDVPILYLSRFFIQNHSDYYRYLREVTEEGKWEQWILYVLAAVEQTSRETAHTIETINTLIGNVITHAQGKTQAIEREGFVDLLFKWPYCKINIVQEELQCSRHTATKYLIESLAGMPYVCLRAAYRVAKR